MKTIGSSRDKTGMTLYQILGVEPTATAAQVHAAYLALAKIHHPDLDGGEESEAFRQIKHAHDVLFDQQSRMIYDETGLIASDPAAKLDIMAIAMIRNFTLQVLNGSGIDCNVLDAIRRSIEKHMAGIEQEITIANRTREKIEKAQRNITERWKGSEQVKKALLMMLDGTAEEQRNVAAAKESELPPVKRALDMLVEAKYEMPAEVRRQQPMMDLLYGQMQGLGRGLGEI